MLSCNKILKDFIKLKHFKHQWCISQPALGQQWQQGQGSGLNAAECEAVWIGTFSPGAALVSATFPTLTFTPTSPSDWPAVPRWEVSQALFFFKFLTQWFLSLFYGEQPSETPRMASRRDDQKMCSIISIFPHLHLHFCSLWWQAFNT